MATIKFSIEVSDQDIDDLMVTALEGGINYWCGKVKVVQCPVDYTFASDVISKGGVLKLYDAGSSDTWQLTKEKFLKGLEWYCREYNYANMIDLIDGHDAETADVIVQVALFDEIVFG